MHHLRGGAWRPRRVRRVRGRAPNTYTAAITFTNTDTGQGTQTRTATLTVNAVNAGVLQVTPTGNIVVAGMARSGEP